jgi:hypothetical protein
MDFGRDFGQKVDLTASIRNILRNYPEGTAVLKELVQNADDAGASHISFCLDCRQHGCASLAAPALSSFQGPSLTIYNNATFSEEDFKSIQRIGDSLKKTAENKGKIGRFGIGFNAVYHWTDLPSFISSKYLVLLDPQAEFLPNVNPSNPGKIVDFISNPEVLVQFRDQFAPYVQHGGLDFSRGAFNGTLFRLPLRTAEQATTSRLSRRALSAPEAMAILNSLRAEASAMLLFLKNVESIEIKVWHPQNTEPTMLFNCRIENISRELREKRAFVGKIVSQTQAATSSSGFNTTQYPVADFSLSLECNIHGSLIAAVSATDTSGSNSSNSASSSAVVSKSGMNRYTETWEVANQLGGRAANKIANDPANDLLKLVPWGGVAAFIRSTAAWEQVDVPTVNQYGQAYCFLPLPVTTGLPVMVNGFFELSSNRRDVWQDGGDMTGDGKTRAEWNLSLMSDVVSPCYIRLLTRLKDVLGFSERYQQLWPQYSIAAPWNLISKSTLRDCADKKLLCVATMPESAASMVAVSINHENADTIDESEQIEARKKSGGRSSVWNFAWKIFGEEEARPVAGNNTPLSPSRVQWVECRHAVLLTSAELSEAHGNILAHCLLATKQSFVSCIPSLHKTLVESSTCTILATPSFVRRSLKQTDVSAKFIPPPLYCSFLLQYCMSDLKAAVPSVELDGLSIIPLVNDSTSLLRIYSEVQYQALSQITSMGYSTSIALTTLARFNFDVARAADELQTVAQSPRPMQVATVLIVCSDVERDVFQGAKEMIVDRDNIRPNEIQFLSHREMQRRSNIRLFEPSMINDMLAHILPAPCLNGGHVLRSQLTTEQYYELSVFLNKFWEYLPLHPEAITAISQGPSIVPCNQGASFLSLSGISTLIGTKKGDIMLPPSIVEVLRILGVNIVDEIISEQQNLPKAYWNFVQGPHRAGIIAVIDAVCRNFALTKPAQASKDVNSPFDLLSDSQRQTLWHHLCSCESIQSLSPNEITLLRKFPVIVTYDTEGPSQYTSFDGWNRQAQGKLTLLRDSQRFSDILLPRNYVKYMTPQEALLLETIGVKSIRRVDFFREELLPKAESFTLSAPLQASYITAITDMLTEINSLVKDDPSFSNFLRNVPFIPSTLVPVPAPEALRTQLGTSPAVEASLHVKAMLYRAGELFDPQVGELVLLLDPSFFPIVSFNREDVLVYLRTLGLQTSLDWKGILACARFIANIDESSGPQSQQQKRLRGLNLLHFLDKNYDRLVMESKPVTAAAPAPSGFGFIRSLFGEKVSTESSSAPTMSPEDSMRQLSAISWIPVVIEPPGPNMPWYSLEATSNRPTANYSNLSCAASPKNVRLLPDAWYCSYSKRICSENLQSSSLKRAFGWLDPLDWNSLALQLRELSSIFLAQRQEPENKTPSLDPGETSSDQLLLEMKQNITGLIPQFYQRLDLLARENGLEILSVLETQSWIWVGDTFVNSDRVARRVTVNATPYLYQLPQDLQVYYNLMKLFKIRDEFSARDYVQVLRSMAEAANAISSAPPVVVAKPSNVSTAAGSGPVKPVAVSVPPGRVATSSSLPHSQPSIRDIIPLSDAKIDLAVSIITLLGSEGSINPNVHTIYIPDTQGRMAVSTELVNDDVPWLSGPEYASIRSSCRLIHKSISSSVAEKFGVKSMRLFLVNSNLNQSLFAIPDTTVEAFGQSESITNRLKTILDMYPDGNPIFSELIQNADDAGARQVCIMLDENSYG